MRLSTVWATTLFTWILTRLLQFKIVLTNFDVQRPAVFLSGSTDLRYWMGQIGRKRTINMRLQLKTSQWYRLQSEYRHTCTTNIQTVMRLKMAFEDVAIKGTEIDKQTLSRSISISRSYWHPESGVSRSARTSSAAAAISANTRK